MAIRNAGLTDVSKVVAALSNTAPSSSTPTRVSLKNWWRVTAIITVKNGSTVTGSAITLKQATAVAGTGEKALAFSTYNAISDTTNSTTGDIPTATAAVSNTFTTLTTNSAQAQYTIEVKASDLDVANGFDVFRVGTGDAINATLTVTYILSDPKFTESTAKTALTD